MRTLTIFLCLTLSLCAQTNQPTIRNDNSDWWSALRSSDTEEEINSQSREPASSNFTILNIELDDDMFTKAQVKFGKTYKIHRGDASSGREQACYVSSGASVKTHLIFEKGEVAYSFYLFTGGADWSGSDLCTPSKTISHDISTASGLHLGQTPAQVMSILGKPSARRSNELLYSFMLQKINSPKDLVEARRNHPEMTDKDFHENYDFYSLGVGIDTKFTAGKLTYLSVLKSETY
jgi:hypothetical protein